MDFNLTEEQTAFRDTVHRWVDAELPKDLMRKLEADEENYPYEIWDKLKEQGFFGIGIPEEYGGLGGDVVMQMIFAREMARTAGGLLWVWGLTSFGGAKTLATAGTEEQRKKWLPQMAAGDLRVSLSMTEPDGGTDVLGAMKTYADKVEGGWKINGAKMWTTAARAADRLLVLCRSDRNAAKKHHGLTAFFVDAKSPGIIATLLPKLGMRAMGSCSVTYDDVFVPDEDVLGEPHKAWSSIMLPISPRPRSWLNCCSTMSPGCRHRACRAVTRQICSRWLRPNAQWRRRILASRYWAAWAIRQKPTCSVTGAITGFCG